MQTAMHNLNGKNLADLMSQQSEVFEKLNEYEEHLEKNNGSGPMSGFWQLFLNMMYILFAFIRSIRMGNWKLHLESTQLMLPWMFAYDRPNYARYLNFYWSEMKALSESHPAIHTEFENLDFLYAVHSVSSTRLHLTNASNKRSTERKNAEVVLVGTVYHLVQCADTDKPVHS
eukprot:gene755-41_t